MEKIEIQKYKYQYFWLVNGRANIAALILALYFSLYSMMLL